MRQMTEMSL